LEISIYQQMGAIINIILVDFDKVKKSPLVLFLLLLFVCLVSLAFTEVLVNPISRNLGFKKTTEEP